VKSLHAFLSCSLFAGLLGACASRSERAEAPDAFAARREQSDTTAQRLRPGMTKEEIKRELNLDAGNCEGSPEAIEICELTFWTGSDGPAASFGLPPSDYSRNEYTTYKLTFQRHHLKTWDRATTTRYHGEEQPRH
jgi:hypothetical protein